MKPDLTLRKMLEALKLITGDWPSRKEYNVTANSFWCDSSTKIINYEAHDMIKKLGFDDVEIHVSSAGFKFQFIWKEKNKK